MVNGSPLRLPLLLLICTWTFVLGNWGSGDWTSNENCASDPVFSDECMRAVRPPYPVCEFKTPAEWVAKAQESVGRCCGDDLSECRCPKKESERFQAKIEGHCAGVAACSSSARFTPQHLRGANEEPVQRIDRETGQ